MVNKEVSKVYLCPMLTGAVGKHREGGWRELGGQGGGHCDSRRGVFGKALQRR